MTTTQVSALTYSGDTATTQTLDFRYDENGHPYELIHTIGDTTTTYYYITNLQGDVMHLVDGDGAAVASYTYDPYGNILTATGELAEVNPLRYRGYYYDGETGFYCLSSRYYDPEVGRFISADDISMLGANGDIASLNLFAYCGNNPISRRDASGHAWETIFDVLSLGASILEVAFNPADPFAWIGLAGDTIDLIPFVTGVGETIRALKTTSKVAETIEGAGDAIDTYRDLKKVTKGTGLEVHHIVEKRLGNALGYENTNDMLSIALEKTEHRKYTSAWRRSLSYGSRYDKKAILTAAIEIYANNPKLLGAAIYTIAK